VIDDKDNTTLSTAVVAIGGGLFICLYNPFWGIAATLAGGVGLIFALATRSKFDVLFKNLKLGKNEAYPILKSKTKTERGFLYKFTLPAGLSVEDFDKNQTAIEQHLGFPVVIKYTFKEITIEEIRSRVKVTYEAEFPPSKGQVSFWVGYDEDGKLTLCDLAAGDPHMMIAGSTGSGKSTALRYIITQLCLKGIRLHLIDLKRGAEFQIFAKCKNVISFCRTRAEAEKTLKGISCEVDRRYDMFYKYDCVDIREYNKKVGGLKYEVVIIDEFADLQYEDSSISILEEIAAKARACGIHLIISTQRPDSHIVNGRIKCNITSILGLKATNDTNSKIIIDRTGLEKLRGNGHGIFKKGGKETEIQCPLLSTEKARELLKDIYVQKDVELEHRPDGEVLDFDFLEAVNDK
jgi:S-DNA-T family DNA segregation ATPase FtsK/SpoIIIE